MSAIFFYFVSLRAIDRIQYATNFHIMKITFLFTFPQTANVTSQNIHVPATPTKVPKNRKDKTKILQLRAFVLFRVAATSLAV